MAKERRGQPRQWWWKWQGDVGGREGTACDRHLSTPMPHSNAAGVEGGPCRVMALITARPAAEAPRPWARPLSAAPPPPARG